jgi:pyruvate formate lyase activating enzyme
MDIEGIVFDIQGFSIHDGPGIRTLVFLKGCHLRCPWCSNPESQRFEPELFFHPERCIGCHKCLQICPQGAIRILDGNLSFNRSLCQNCGKCSRVCYAEARVMKGRQMTADQVVEEVLKDDLFYLNSGGGVTLGGGEPLAQADFAAEILMKCKKKGLHTTIETAGYVPWPQIEKVLPYTDLFVYDVKHMDPGKHSNIIGVDNQLILANLERLLGANKQVVACTPLIPGFNDTVRQIRAIARHVGRLGIGEIHLLPYHRFGAGKYHLLGSPYPFQGKEELSEKKGEALKESATLEGLCVKFGG